MNPEQKAKYFLLYLGFFFLDVVLTLTAWNKLVDDHLYYCSDKTPLLDFLPPFAHGVQTNDFFIAPPIIVYLLWIILIINLFLTPLLLISFLKKLQKSN